MGLIYRYKDGDKVNTLTKTTKVVPNEKSIASKVQSNSMLAMIEANKLSKEKKPIKEKIKTNVSSNNTKSNLLDEIYFKLNPYNWGLNDYTNKNDFSKAYETAKKAGEEEFIFKNKRYNTKYAGTPRQEIGRYGIEGKSIHTMDLNNPARTNVYPPLGDYLPGHIASEMPSPYAHGETISVDYSPHGNRLGGIRNDKLNKKSYYTYNYDPDIFLGKAIKLPGDRFTSSNEFGIEGKLEYKPSTWNLFTNNCADNVCDVFNVPRSKGIQTPQGAIKKIKEKYPTLDVTGRTPEDYENFLEEINSRENYSDYSKGYTSQKSKKALNNVDKLLSIYYSPETSVATKYNIAGLIQKSLIHEGHKLPGSMLYDENTVDEIIGPETESAIKDWKNKNKKN